MDSQLFYRKVLYAVLSSMVITFLAVYYFWGEALGGGFPGSDTRTTVQGVIYMVLLFIAVLISTMIAEIPDARKRRKRFAQLQGAILAIPVALFIIAFVLFFLIY